MNAAEALSFEHAGPEDASGPPFVIAVGMPAASTETRWLVTAPCLAEIRAIVVRHGAARQPDSERAGAFAVHAASLGTLVLPPEGMRSVLGVLHRMYEWKQVAPPAMLVIQETLNRRALQ
jgi:hypothetical protein